VTAPLTCRLAGPIGSARLLEGSGGAQPAPDAQAARLYEQLQAERAELARAREALAAGAARLAGLEGELIRQAQQQVLELALEIAARVLSQEIRAARHEIEPIVAEAMRRVPSRRDVVVHLHPEDLARCTPPGEAIGADDEADVRFVADPAVPVAGCLIETPEGVVESDVAGNLQRLAEALRGQE